MEHDARVRNTWGTKVKEQLSNQCRHENGTVNGDKAAKL